ncbi:EamA family transporter RarD [Nocardioides mesophilus]|uniref:EamA family transporter RarD n=2 Tax=Nocardioides mesophilus TaxID=433659 RepID=A0A7G9RHC9_9ACTN|nr:EamA family transporter RarD [Nocardioides mesophilus]
MWGFFPLYWPLLEPTGAVEILAHRIVWSMIVMVLAVLVLRRGRRLRETVAERRTLLLLAVAAVLITTNWGVYIWGVNSHHVVETSLGYFINPLVSVLLGVLVLGERLRPLQWVAMGIAGAAVLALTVEYGRPPWIALALALSFGSYGLVKKAADAGAVESLVVETLFVAPFALGYLAYLAAQGVSTFGTNGAGHVLLLVGTGVVTVIPLLCFGAAATRIPLSTLGLLQYLTPTVQFILGIVVFDEPMPTMRWFGFALIWLALVLFTFESLRHRTQARSLRVAAETPTP